jgi:hypothetical protein
MPSFDIIVFDVPNTYVIICSCVKKTAKVIAKTAQ